MAQNGKSKQTYKYRIAESILGSEGDEYALTQEEYYRLYSFFVTLSLCRGQSFKGKDFVYYGWPSNSVVEQELARALQGVLNLKRNRSFIFTDKDDLAERFSSSQLENGPIADLSFERSVIGRTSADNNYLKLFYRVRDCFAHGKFRLRINDRGEKMVIMQDDNGNNVTARLVLKLDTLLAFVDVIDRDRIL